MGSRSTCMSLALVMACTLGLAACGEVPLDQLPDDATAFITIDTGEDFAFVSWRLENDSCVQLPADATARFNGTPLPEGEMRFGGRGGNPLAAYLDLGCEPPSGFWGLTTAPTPPFVLEVESGGVTLVMELSDPREIERCDFPACVSESFVEEDVERERP